MQPVCRAYIDIETTGLNPRYSELTVVGICLEQANGQELVQLYEQALTPMSTPVHKRLFRAECSATYRASQFDAQAQPGADRTDAVPDARREFG